MEWCIREVADRTSEPRRLKNALKPYRISIPSIYPSSISAYTFEHVFNSRYSLNLTTLLPSEEIE